MTYGDRVFHPESGEYGDVLGAAGADHLWVWFDPDSEPSPVNPADLEEP